MSVNELYRALYEIVGEGNILENEPLSKHTTFRIGGPARYFLTPDREEALKEVILMCKDNNIDFYVIGNGSNLLVSDKGYDGVVIKIGESLREIRCEEDKIYATAGATLAGIAQTALKNSLTGFEFAAGIPGTLGGAIYMNAGAYGGEIKQVVREVTYLNANLQPEHPDEDGIEWSSSNPGIATVEDSSVKHGAKVTGVAAGKATITATAKDGSGVKGSIEIEVVTVPTSITFDGKTDQEIYTWWGKEVDLKAKVTPEGVSLKTLTWRWIDVNASSYPYCENNSLMIIAHMSTYYESDEFKDILSMNLDIDKDGINVIHYNNDFNCKPFEGNANLTIGDKAVLFEDGMADDSELKAEVEWNKGVISFNYDGKKWIAKNI